MRILICEDDPVSRRVLASILSRWGYQVQATSNGAAAWEALRGPDSPKLAILDWILPEMDGVQVCRQVRALEQEQPSYLILLTVRGGKHNVVAALQAGADDYLTKPYDHDELRARIQVGQRIVTLQQGLARRVGELEQALAGLKTLQGLLPICCYCKRIRHDGDYWQQVEAYISEHSESRFSHGICPECYEGVVRAQMDQASKMGTGPLESQVPSPFSTSKMGTEPLESQVPSPFSTQAEVAV
jgi:CheY-like chemotaxis protein